MKYMENIGRLCALHVTIRKRLFIIVFLLFCACNTKNERIESHWHFFNKDNGKVYHTLDLFESIYIINNKVLVGFDTDTGKLVINNDSVYLYDFFGEDTRGYILEDTFYLYTSKWKELGPCKYYQVNNNIDDKIADLYCDYNYEIILPKVREEMQVYEKKYFDIVLNISTFKYSKELMLDKYYIDNKYLLNKGNKLVQLNQIYDMVELEKLKSESITLDVLLNADKNVPELMIDSICNLLNKHSSIQKIYQSFFCIETENVTYKIVKE